MGSESRGALLARKAIILTAVIVPLVATVYAIYRLWNSWVTWTDLGLLLGFHAAAAMGVTIGYHRMLTHRGFEASAPVRYFFLAMASMSLQGSPTEWASTHLKHHAKADREGDPHSPLHGFWHSHFGWLLKEPDVEDVYVKPFRGDPAVKWADRTWLLWAVAGFAVPFAIGGWTGLLWGGAVRVFLGHHITWSVNSVCHTFGKRPFETKDESRNEPFVGLLAFGEGWHNNHHASPQSAIHGFEWWQFDASGYVIRLMEKLRIVRNVKRYRKPSGGRPEPFVVTAEKW